MQWEFTPDEVVKGTADYTLAEFRRDLAEEVRANLGGDDECFARHSYDLIYDLCHWLATGRDFAEFVATLPEDAPLEAHVLQVIKEHMRDNIAMLGAILQRMIMDGVEAGLPLDQALDQASRRHAATVAALA
jgi:hypothetical protein